MKKTIYTIGYGGRRPEDFVSLLKQFGIEQAVDVRAFPTSKYEGYKREELETFLPQHGISYLWMGELGGYRRGGYEAYTRQRKFGEGLERLEEVAGEKPTVIMCLEGYPSGCHRRFISRELAREGMEGPAHRGEGKNSGGE